MTAPVALVTAASKGMGAACGYRVRPFARMNGVLPGFIATRPA